MITVKFANGNEYNVESVDEAINKCLADGNDPFNPVVIETIKQAKETKTKE